MSSTSAPDPRPGLARWSLAARLTVWYAGAAFLLVLGATAFLSWALHANLEREDDEFLAEKVRTLRRLLQDTTDEAAVCRAVLDAGGLRGDARFHVRVLDHDGRVVAETIGMSEALGPSIFPAPVPEDAAPGPGVEFASPADRSYRLTAARAVGPAGAERYVLQVAFDRTYEEELLARYRRNVWLVLAAALVACAVGGYQIARRGLRPVAQIAEAARRIRATTLHERIPPGDFPAELAALAVTVNEMLDRLEESFTRLSRFSADIAHELRTPVNNLRGEAEVTLGKPRSPEEYREVLGSCLEECGRLSRLIDSLLFLARAENAEMRPAREPVDVRSELETVRAFYEAAAAEAGLALTVKAPEGLTAELDRTLFQRAVSNLVANALAHTPPGGAVTVSATTEGEVLRVEVADTGSGIAPEHLPHVFDRFFRGDAARSGGGGRVGLGLALVKSIAGLHRGTATIASVVGRGTRVTLTLPRREPSDALPQPKTCAQLVDTRRGAP